MAPLPASPASPQQQEQEQQASAHSLPGHLLARALDNLPCHRDLARCCVVSSEWSSVARSDSLWALRYEARSRGCGQAGPAAAATSGRRRSRSLAQPCAPVPTLVPPFCNRPTSCTGAKAWPAAAPEAAAWAAPPPACSPRPLQSAPRGGHRRRRLAAAAGGRRTASVQRPRPTGAWASVAGGGWRATRTTFAARSWWGPRWPPAAAATCSVTAAFGE